MIIEMLITMILKFVDWLTAIQLPDFFYRALDVVMNSINSFLYFLPQHPLIPWGALAIGLSMVLGVFIITIIYKLIRSLIGYFLGG